MMFLLIFLAQGTYNQPQSLSNQLYENAKDSFYTMDGEGKVVNEVGNSIINKQPSQPFQNIFQNLTTGIVTIRNSLNGINPLNNFNPYIEFEKHMYIAILQREMFMEVDVSHKQLTGGGGFSFYADIVLKKVMNNFIQDSITILLTNWNGQAIPSQSNLWDGSVYYTSLGNKLYPNYPRVGNFSFKSKIAVSRLVSILIDRKIVHPGDIIFKIMFRGDFRDGGSYETNFSYNISDQFINRYKKGILGITYAPYELNYDAPEQNTSDYQYLSHQKAPLDLHTFGVSHYASIQFSINNISNKAKPCNGERIGLYDGSSHLNNIFGSDLNYFPLDPKLKTKYLVSFRNSLNCVLFPCQVALCFEFSLRNNYDSSTGRFTQILNPLLITSKILICTQNTPSLKDGIMMEQFEYSDLARGIIGVKFSLYEKANTTGTQPHVYTFVPNISIQINDLNTVQLFFFVNRLANAGKFQPNERISEVSKCFRAFQGTGKYLFYEMRFPDKIDLSVSTPVCHSNQIQLNGTCVCAPGYFLDDKNNKISCVNNQVKRNLNCFFRNENLTYDNCLTSAASIQTRIILNVRSFPNIVMVLRISQLFSLTDDFMFYIYHNQSYGQEFKQFLYCMWNITVQRWIPFSISSFYYNIQDAYEEKIKVKNTGLIPEVWINLGQNTSFLNNTRDFWIGAIPMSLIVFIVLHLLMKKFNIKFCYNFIQFNWFIIFMNNIFLQNAQLLSFRAFQQILYGGSPLAQQLKIMFYINRITSYLTLFCVVICTCVGHYIIKIFIGNNIRQVMELVRYSNPAIWLLTMMQVFRAANGLLHSIFSLDNISKISILFATQIASLVAIVYFRAQIRLKSMYVLLIFEYILRNILHFILWIRILCGYLFQKLGESVIGDLQITLICIIFGVTALELLTIFCRESSKYQMPTIEPNLKSGNLAMLQQKHPKYNSKQSQETSISRIQKASQEETSIVLKRKVKVVNDFIIQKPIEQVNGSLSNRNNYFKHKFYRTTSKESNNSIHESRSIFEKM